MDNEIKIFDAVIDPYDYKTGINRLSFVEFPATEMNWKLFSKDNNLKKYTFSEDGEKREVLSVVMLADTPIYRIDDWGQEYYLRFSKETIRQMAEKFLIGGASMASLDDEHRSDTFLPGVCLFEWFIKDAEKGISPTGFEDVPDGSLFASFKIHNDDIWQDIKEGRWNGISLEGIFSIEYPEDQEEQDILALIETLYNRINKKTENTNEEE